MDEIIKLLQGLYAYVYNQPSTDTNGNPTTVISATQSRSDIGLPTNTLLDVIVTVNGNNTLTATYGEENILDVISVPDAKEYIEDFINRKMNEAFIDFESNKPETKVSPEALAPIDASLDINELSSLRKVYSSSGGSKQKLPHRVKPINPAKPLSHVKPIKPVRQIQPWRSILPEEKPATSEGVKDSISGEFGADLELNHLDQNTILEMLSNSENVPYIIEELEKEHNRLVKKNAPEHILASHQNFLNYAKSLLA